MWSFTGFGFFSVIQHRDDPELLLVRARVREDLVNLKKYLPNLGDITDTPNADYPYRALAWRVDYAEAMKRAILDIDYTNFKNGVTKTQGHARHDLYMRVWGVMRTAEQTLGVMDREARRVSLQNSFPYNSSGPSNGQVYSIRGKSSARRSAKEEDLLADYKAALGEYDQPEPIEGYGHYLDDDRSEE